MSDLLLGYGEVGSALAVILSERRDILIHDPPKGPRVELGREPVEWMHITFPYSEDFQDTVIRYIEVCAPQYAVIHSTVKVGTTNEIVNRLGIGSPTSIVYSPVRGIHPHLARYIREFPKWYYANATAACDAYEALMARAGVQCRKAPSYDVLEWMKIWETTEYGYRIAMWQEIERELASMFPSWGSRAERYRESLSAMKDWLYEKRKVYDGDRGLCPIMFGGIIGGHCVMSNVELSKEIMTKQLYDWLTTSNTMRMHER